MVILLLVKVSGPVASPAAPRPEPPLVATVSTGGTPSVAVTSPESVTLPALSEIDPTMVIFGVSFDGIVSSRRRYTSALFTTDVVGTFAPPVSSVTEKSAAATVSASTLPSKVTLSDFEFFLSILLLIIVVVWFSDEVGIFLFPIWWFATSLPLSYEANTRLGEKLKENLYHKVNIDLIEADSADEAARKYIREQAKAEQWEEQD